MKNIHLILLFSFSFLVLSCGKQPVVPEYPQQSAIVQTYQPEFRWQSASEKGVFEIQVTDDILFTSIIEDATDIQSTSYVSKTMLKPGVYFYRVREKQGFGTGPWSEIIIFTVESPGVEIIHPKNHQKINVGNEFYVNWKPVMHAEQYQVQLSGEKNFKPYLVNKTTSDTVFQTTFPEVIDVCYIRVRAKFKAGVKTDWCKTVQIQPFFEEEYYGEAEMPDEDELGIINFLCQSWTGNFGWWTFNQDHTYSYSYQDSYEGAWDIEGNTIVLDKETNPRTIPFEDITENTLQLGEALLYEQNYYEELNKAENSRRENLMQNTIPVAQWDKSHLMGEWGTSEEGPDGGLMIFAFEGDAAYMSYDYNPEPGCWFIEEKKNPANWYFDKASNTIIINGNLYGSEEEMKVAIKITSLSHGAMKGYFTKETTTMFDEIENGPEFVREFYQAACK